MKESQMNVLQPSVRMHPLMTIAAISVTVVSLLGIAAITGILPNSHGSATQTTLAVPAPPAKTPYINAGAVARHEPVGHLATHNHPVYAQDRSIPAGPTAQNSPLGIGAGAVLGGLLGSQVGGGNGKTLATIAGAVGGGYLGNEIAKKNQ
jgi:uncharacterized protein YcfJ